MRKDLCPSVSSIEPSRPCGPTWAGRCLEIDSTLPIVRDRVRSAVPRPCPVASPRGEAGPPSVHCRAPGAGRALPGGRNASQDRKSTRLNSSHPSISYAVFCLKKKKQKKYSHHLHPAISLTIPTLTPN